MGEGESVGFLVAVAFFVPVGVAAILVWDFNPVGGTVAVSGGSVAEGVSAAWVRV